MHANCLAASASQWPGQIPSVNETRNWAYRCSSQKFGLIDADGSVNKTAGRRLTNSSIYLDEDEREAVLALWDTCDTWDDCLSEPCSTTISR